MAWFEVYRPRYRGDAVQVRAWRARLYLARWGWRAGWEIGASVGRGGLVVSVVLAQVRLIPWSHRDDCECERCLPF